MNLNLIRMDLTLIRMEFIFIRTDLSQTDMAESTQNRTDTFIFMKESNILIGRNDLGVNPYHFYRL